MGGSSCKRPSWYTALASRLGSASYSTSRPLGSGNTKKVKKGRPRLEVYDL